MLNCALPTIGGLSARNALIDNQHRDICGNREGFEMDIFIEDVVGTSGIYSLPVSNRFGGTTLVTVVLVELLWRHQTVIVDGTAYPVECYRAWIRDKHAQRHVGTKFVNVNARQTEARRPQGGRVQGWVLTAQ